MRTKKKKQQEQEEARKTKKKKAKGRTPWKKQPLFGSYQYFFRYFYRPLLHHGSPSTLQLNDQGHVKRKRKQRRKKRSQKKRRPKKRRKKKKRRCG
jgi:hypothetical protein